jgi:hypothetical protein
MQNYSIEEDLAEAEAMLKGFERYLRGNDVYGSVTGGFFNFGNMPALTLGALVMRLRRLEALREQMTAEQRQRLEIAQRQHDQIRQDWHAHYEKKALREANSRLNTMQQYFADLGQGTDAASGYGPEQLHRTIVQELLGVMAEMGVESADLEAKLRYIDNRLNASAVEYSGFSWDPVLEPVYPQMAYWWLYKQPRSRR